MGIVQSPRFLSKEKHVKPLEKNFSMSQCLAKCNCDLNQNRSNDFIETVPFTRIEQLRT